MLISQQPEFPITIFSDSHLDSLSYLSGFIERTPVSPWGVFHFSPLCNSSRQETSGVLRTEGKMLHPAGSSAMGEIVRESRAG